MTDKLNILVVVDPTQTHHPSLERALVMARQSQRQLHLIFLLLSTEQTRKSDDLTSLTCSGQWVNEHIHAPVAELGIEHSILISWSKNWSETLLALETREDVGMTLISFYGSGREHLLSDDNWKLLRNSSKPILIARQKEGETSRRLLASIKTQDSSYEERNKNVINGAQTLAEVYNMELHVVNAYTDSLSFPDRAKVAALAAVPNEHVHIKVGEPQKVICDVARDINADLVLISSHQRKGFQGMLRGNTVEKIIAGVGRDVLMI